ncbi:MAG: alpha/beta hydrolase [Ilumatobacter sp.]|uniref:alpha/beta fold hydrolase n=1 Tax=Ilumatobacter sp. TaxID=1967498 RepID=UPI003C723D9F
MTSETASAEVVMLRHNRIDLALHLLRPEPLDAANPSRPLLLLHGLGDRSPAATPAWVEDWPGAIAALDFTGHGESTCPASGGYSPETLMADVDQALAHLTNDDPEGSITVLGRGLGAYVALQIAGARASQVHGVILVDGPGLAGGPTGPSSQAVFSLQTDGTTPDPYALVELGRDLRPGDYAVSFVGLANAGAPVTSPITVASSFRPKWLAAVVDSPGVAEATIADALASYA